MLDRGEVGDGAAHADHASGRAGRRGDELAGDRGDRRIERASSDDAVEAEVLGEAHRADIHAEALGHVARIAERELRAAAAGVEDDQRAARLQTRRGGQIGQPGLLVAGDDLDGDAAASLHGRDELGGVRCDAQAGRTDGGDRLRPGARRVLGHARDRLGRARHGRRSQPSGPLEVLAEARHLGTIGERLPRPVGGVLGEQELDGVGADVDDRDPPRAEPCEDLEAARDGRVLVSVETERAPGPAHELRIVGFDRDRPDRSPRGGHVRELGHASADRVPPSPLVDEQRAQSRARGDQLVDRVDRPVPPPTPSVVSTRSAASASSGSGALSTGSHCWSPSERTRCSSLTSTTPSRSFTDASLPAEEHVEIVALVIALGLQRRQVPLGLRDVLPEGPPLPAADLRQRGGIGVGRG